MPGVAQGTADHQQPKRHLMPDAEVGGKRLVWRIDQKNFHAILPVRGRPQCSDFVALVLVKEMKAGRISRRL